MAEQTQQNRIYWLDNLRTFMIFLVVLLHAAIVYEKNSLGAAWWIVCQPSGSDLPGLVFIILNIFVIATIFFVSGYVTPLSLQNKTGWAFIKSKFKRLMVPWFIACLTLIPVYKVIFLYSRNLPQEHWTTYFHWNSLWSQNWLWFLPVLFLFDVLYLLWSKLNINLPCVTFIKAVWTVFGVSVMYCFCMDFFGLHGWTKTILIDFQNERLLIYLMVFLLGAACCRLRVFDSKWKNKKLDLFLHCTGWLPINLYIFLLIYSLVKPGDYLISRIADTLILRTSFVLSVAYMLYTMITAFKQYLNKHSRIATELNKNSYGVYIIHVIVMGAIALIMQDTQIPSLVKLLILTASTFLACNLIISFYRKVRTRIIQRSLPSTRHGELSLSADPSH